MGFFQDMFRRRVGRHGAQQAAQRGAGLPGSVRSPHAVVEPHELVYADVFGDTDAFSRRLTRADAMMVPAIATARNRVIEKLAGRPLVDYDPAGRAVQQPSWMTRTDNRLLMSPYQRLVETLDDLIFDGPSLWATERGGAKQLMEAMHVPQSWWSLDPDGTVLVDGEPAPADQVILIPGPHRGILHEARETIRGGIDLERAWRARARNPIPTILLKEREMNGMTREEAREYVDGVAAARRNPEGAVMFIPYQIEAEIPAGGDTDHLEAARNAIRIDIAGYFDLTAQSVEGSKNQSTLTYETAETSEAQTADRMAFWSEPIEARLSMDDVVPRGHRVRFDFTDSTNAATGTHTTD